MFFSLVVETLINFVFLCHNFGGNPVPPYHSLSFAIQPEMNYTYINKYK